MHERIKWRREDFAHKLSRRFVDEFGVIAFEDLNVKDMVKTGVLLKASRMRHGINWYSSRRAKRKRLVDV